MSASVARVRCTWNKLELTTWCNVIEGGFKNKNKKQLNIFVVMKEKNDMKAEGWCGVLTFSARVCFSLHVPSPPRTVDFVASCYSTESCKCKLRDIACLKWYVNLFSCLLEVCFSGTASRCQLLVQQTSRSWQLSWFSHTVHTCEAVTGRRVFIPVNVVIIVVVIWVN